ncbi:glycosyltransferase family 2 protein [Actinoplanes sp. RD1]|uniref:glycosyltransferase family 2 protein n=1 Tax=Actinoplanes sp. RD1 TaxID=3064538 RepID=UPI0027410CAC|nr:glycosyltransferase [Actinoplanes sp. RD1]
MTRAPIPYETSDVTVVVATRNRRERLLETLPRHAAPVIVVDNGSDDGSPEAIAAAFPHVTMVPLGENRAAAARTAGAELARTSYVAFADDDSWWEPGSLAALAGLFRAHPRAGLLAARVLAGPDRREDPVSAAQARAPLGTPPGAPGPAILGFLACSVAVRREDFLAAGGFRPQLRVYGEEALLAVDLAAAGRHLSYVPQLTVRHVPLSEGRDPRARRRLEARNRLLTAMLRRPPAVVARTAAAAWRDDPRSLADAVRLLPWALRERQPLPPHIEKALVRLADEG